MEWILEPWPWYLAGPLIGLIVALLLLLTGKSLGISSTFRHIGSICTPKSRFSYIKDNNWRQHGWNLLFVTGIIVGAIFASRFLTADPRPFLPESYNSPGGILLLALGGLLIGFGARYADGCTSGHTIMGLSNLRLSSLIASICFFIGGIFSTYVILGLLAITG